MNLVSELQEIEIARQQLAKHMSESYGIISGLFEEIELHKSKNLHMIMAAKLESDVIVTFSAPFRDEKSEKMLTNLRSLFEESHLLFSSYMPIESSEVSNTELYKAIPFLFKIEANKAYAMTAQLINAEFEDIILTNDNIDTVLHIRKDGDRINFSFYEKEEE